jgi:hypothetical protein
LGDSLSRGTRPADIASRVASARTISLRQSLGINDRFLVISAVFKDNREAYEKVIDELDALDDLDEAMIHIYENYAWDPNNEGVKVLIDLLTRKLS